MHFPVLGCLPVWALGSLLTGQAVQEPQAPSALSVAERVSALREAVEHCRDRAEQVLSILGGR